MSNLDDKLETIEVWFDVNIGHGHCPPNETPENCKYLELKQAIKDCFKEWVVEVIGEDETIRWDDWKDNVAVAEARNDLRAEQRKRMEGQNG